jgi:uncharacterized repeat protein (TIGR03847 family)
MRRRIIDIDAPDRFVAATTGEADDEAVYLQAVHDHRVVTVALERQQVAQLGHRMLLICGELERRGLLAIEAGAPSVADPSPGGPGSSSGAVLAGPPREEFRVGTLTIAWDNDSSRVIVEAFALVFDAGAGESALMPDTEPDDEDMSDDDPLGPDVMRVRLTPLMALRFARQAARIAS